MRYALEFTTSAARELRALDAHLQNRISRKLEALAENPFPAGVQKFQGQKDHWRIRIGDYRVIYRIENERVVIVVVRIGHRREVYH